MNNRGPRTLDGKRAIARNHLKHGLTASTIVLPSESSDEWTAFHDDACARLDAEGSVELALASRVAELLWRLRRVVRAEEHFISVAQTHRNILLNRDERKLIDAQSSADELAPPNAPTERQQLAAQLGFYADALFAGQAMSRFERTLPVLLPADGNLEKIMKYEAHLSRLLNHALHELESLQDRRRGNPARVARIDIN